jgi:CMP-N,N'-diacetyllegionaminic acid synthase
VRSNETLWLIPARSGSKSIPNKNIRYLGEHPLLAYRIRTALKITAAESIWLSTDSDEYAKIGAVAGAKIPFMRPAHLATDTASSMDVVLQAMEFAEQQGKKFSFIGLLEPTSPFIYPELLVGALDKLSADADADAIVAVKEARPNTIFIQPENQYLDTLASNLAKLKNIGRQNFSREITPSGGFYISRWENFKMNKTFYTPKTLPYLVSRESEIEIDDEIDWDFAEFLVRQGKVDINRLI